MKKIPAETTELFGVSLVGILVKIIENKWIV